MARLFFFYLPVTNHHHRHRAVGSRSTLAVAVTATMYYYNSSLTSTDSDSSSTTTSSFAFKSLVPTNNCLLHTSWLKLAFSIQQDFFCRPTVVVVVLLLLSTTTTTTSHAFSPAQLLTDSLSLSVCLYIIPKPKYFLGIELAWSSSSKREVRIVLSSSSSSCSPNYFGVCLFSLSLSLFGAKRLFSRLARSLSLFSVSPSHGLGHFFWQKGKREDEVK